MPVILPRKAEGAKKKERIASPVRGRRGIEKNYRDSLRSLNRAMKASGKRIGDLVRSGASRADVAALVRSELELMETLYERSGDELSRTYVQAMSASTKGQAEKAIAKSFGVEFATIVDTPEIADALQAEMFNNAQYIKNIQSDYFGRVVQAVNDNYQGKLTQGQTLAKRLQSLGAMSDRQAKFLARDQTAKLAGSLTRIRQEAIGVDEYVWRNVKDRRVVGAPGGKWKPTREHGDHWKREGKKYKYSDPPADGNPSQAPGCRCFAEPVLDLDKLDIIYS